MSTEQSEVDMILIRLTIHCVYLLTIWHLFNVAVSHQRKSVNNMEINV